MEVYCKIDLQTSSEIFPTKISNQTSKKVFHGIKVHRELENSIELSI